MRAGRLIAVHQISEPTSLPAAEVLHAKSPCALRVGPRGEDLTVTEELVRPNEIDVKPAKQCIGIPGQRFGGHHAFGLERFSMQHQAGRQRVGRAMVDNEACRPQLSGEPSHRRDHKMHALAMKRLGRQLRRTLHQEHPHLARFRRRERTDAPVGSPSTQTVSISRSYRPGLVFRTR